MNAETILEEIKNAKGAARNQGNLKFWFVPYGEGNKYFFDIFAMGIWADIKHFLSAHGEQELAALLGNVGGLWDLIVHGLEAMEAIGVPESERKKYARTLLGVMEKTKKRDIFLKTKRNTIMGEADVEKLLRRLKPAKGAEEKIMALCGVLTMYSDALCNHWDCFIKEVHGPYKVDGGFLFVRDFSDLSPVDIWPQTGQIPLKSLRIATLCETTDVEMDIFQHYRYISSKSLAEDLKAFAVLGGERGLGVKEIVSLTEKIRLATFSIVSAAEKMSKREKVQKYAEQAYYGMKKFREAIGKDWRPPKELVERINKTVKD